MKNLSKMILSAGLSVLAASLLLTGCGSDPSPSTSTADSTPASSSSTADSTVTSGSASLSQGLDGDGKGNLSSDDLLGGWLYEGQGCLMNFKADGTCTVNYEGGEYECTYACENNAVTLTFAKESAVGELKDNDMLYFNNSKSGFYRDPHATLPAPDSTGASDPAEPSLPPKEELVGEWLYDGQGCILTFKDNNTCAVNYEGTDYDCTYECKNGNVYLIHSSRTAVGTIANNGQLYFDGSTSGFMRSEDSMFNPDTVFIPQAEDYIGDWVCPEVNCGFTVHEDGTCTLQDDSGYVDGGVRWDEEGVFMEMFLDDGRILRADMRDAQTLTVDGYNGYFTKE